MKIIIAGCTLTIFLAAGGKLMQGGDKQEGIRQNERKEYEKKECERNQVCRKETAQGCQEESEMDWEKQDKGRETRQYQVESKAREQYLPGSQVRIPTVEEVSDNQYIYRYNHELGREKGLLEEDCLNYHYLSLQAVYRANLDAYLLDWLDIRELDEELKSSRLGFVSHKPGNRSLYEEESSMGLEYIFLRNNLYIEYLSKDQLNLLEHQLETGKSPVTDEIKAMAGATYREIIKVRDSEDWNGRSSFLYPEASGHKPVIPNHALVLGIANAAEYDALGRLAPDVHRREKYEYLDRIKEEKEREYSEALKTEVYILVE